MKRVVGLPGERVEVRRGDVYVDGQIQRKSLDKQRATAILVHDANYQPVLSPAPPPRWAGEEASTRWGAHGGRFAHPRDVRQDTFDWLVYRHWRRIPNRPGRVEYIPIDDTDGYNQGFPRRIEEVSPVRDLLLSFDLVRTTGHGRLAVRMTDGSTQFEFQVTPATGQYEVRLEGRILPGGTGRLPVPISRNRFEFSTIDQQYLVAVDRTVVGTWKSACGPDWQASTAEPVRIGANRLEAVIENVRLFRDIYYTRPTGVRSRWGAGEPVLLGADELFVLGDNSAVSDDSRTWTGGPGIAATFLTGRPLLVHFPLRRLRVGPLEFQVPDPARMRYIHR